MTTKTIDKPKKVLREGLEKRKKAYEKAGWQFVAHLGEWEAQKDGASFFKEKLSELLDELDALKAIEEKYSDTKVFATNQNIVEVDGARLDDGGDIDRSLSLTLLLEKNAVKNPFVYDGDHYIGTSGVGGAFVWSEIECYKLVPVAEYPEKTHGKILTDNAKNALPEDHPDKYGYNRRPVTHNGKKCVLVGPAVKFVPKQTDTEKLLNIRWEIDITHHSTVLFGNNEEVDKEIQQERFAEDYTALVKLYADFRELFTNADAETIVQYKKRWAKKYPREDSVPQNALDFCFAPDPENTKSFDKFVNKLKFIHNLPQNLNEAVVDDPRRETFEKSGWTLSERGNGTFSANKKFPHNQFTSRIDGAKSWNELLNAVQDVELKESANSETTEGQVIAYEIDLDKIVPSDFEPQIHRRSHFKDADLDELAASIKTDGLLSPITVRPRFDETFQIVCGERRWIATRRAGLTKIACFIKDVSDKTAFDIQSNENLQRKEPDPLDTAVTYQYYIEHFKMTVDDLAVQFNKDKAFITKSLKLNDLIPSAVEDYYNGYLPIGHAAVICRQSPKDQIYILKELTYHENDKSIGAYPLADLKLNIRDEITLKLTTAPFDKEDERLHLKKLKCSECPERTGYKPLLFAEDFGNEDRCLNKSCFELKTNTYRKLQLLEVAETLPNPENKPIEEIAEKIPLVTEKPFVHDKTLKDKVLTNQEILPEKECEYSVLRVVAEGERKNQKVYICENDACEIHHPKPKAEELTETQKIDFKRDFYLKVNTALREKILREGMDAFDDYNPFWKFDDLIKELIVSSLVTLVNYENIFKALTKHWKIPLKFDKYEQIVKFVDELDKSQQSQILFLISKVRFSRPQIMESPTRIETIKKLTKDYTKLDYELLEAQMIVKLAPSEFKDEAEQYLSSIQHGVVPEKKPTFWVELPEDAN